MSLLALLGAHAAPAGGGGFTPADLPNLVAWYDASDLTTITESGGAVSQWDDKSGNGWHLLQGTGGDRPTSGTRTVNGLNVLDFNGTSSKMAVGSVTGLSGNSRTLFVICASDNTDSGTHCVLGCASNWTLRAASDTYRLDCGGGLNSGVTEDSAAHLLIGTDRNGSDSDFIYVDGAGTEGSAGSSTITTLRCGVGSNGVSELWNGTIAEWGACDGIMDPADRALLLAYSQSKWATP